MSFDYAQNLLLQRGRDAGGIAVELVELIEELIPQLDDAKCDDAQDYENDLNGLRAEKSNLIKMHEEEMEELLVLASELADALHSALRHNDLATVKACRETLEKFREKFPKE